MRAISIAAAASIVAVFAVSAWAQPGHGHGKGNGPPFGDPPGAGHGPPQQYGHADIVILPHDRDVVYGYYRTEYAAGHCPPGLAKKHNGCLPPGQAAKMWAIGRPLPVGVAYYPLPPVLLGRLSPAPAGYQYVRVANDILLMAVGTRLIAGALADLSSF